MINWINAKHVSIPLEMCENLTSSDSSGFRLLGAAQHLS